jgi:hypothetical protein
MQDRMTMSPSLRRIAAVARKTAVVAGSALFLGSVFALGADEARSQLRLHAGHSATAPSSAMSIVGLTVLGFSMYRLFAAARDKRKPPAIAVAGLVAGGLLVAVGPVIWGVSAGDILFAFATYQSYKASRDERKMPASAFIGFVIGSLLVAVNPFMIGPVDT